MKEKQEKNLVRKKLISHNLTKQNYSTQNKFTSQKGITLVALVVTIVVLLILAGVSLNLVLGQNGIVNKAKDAKDATARTRTEESVALEVAGSYGIDGKIDMPLLNENLKHIKDLTYNGEALSDTNKIESLPTKVVVDGYEVIIDEEEGTSILGDMPEHPELTGFDWFVVGETEPDEESKDIAEYLIKSGHGQGTLIIYPRNGKSATITASDLEDYYDGSYVPQWCSLINKELAMKITSVYVAPQVSTEHATYFFVGLENCEKIDIANLDTSKVTDMSYMFENCENLKNVNVTNLDVSKVKNMQYMFAYCHELETIEEISDWDVSNVTSMEYLFCDCQKLENINLEKWDVSNVENMRGTLAYGNFKTMDWISNWDVSNVRDFCCMFEGSPITTIDLSNWNTSNATDMAGMFDGCEELTSVDLSNWNTSNVTRMTRMFGGCSLTSIDLSGFNTENVTDMYCMFIGCEELTNVNLSGLNTVNVKSMGYMFSGCKALTSLDLSSFNTKNATNMARMFNGCTQLTTIWSGPDWSYASDKTDMFTACGTDHVTPKS